MSWKEEEGVGEKIDEVKHYPELHLSLKHLPEAKNWEIGKKYKVTLELQMASKNQRNEKKGQGMGHVGFDITGIDVSGSKSGKEKKAPRY